MMGKTGTISQRMTTSDTSSGGEWTGGGNGILYVVVI
jgi:hypothetical protein